MSNRRIVSLTSVVAVSALVGGVLTSPGAHATPTAPTADNPERAPRIAVALNQNRLNQLTENFEVGAIDGERKFVVTLGSLLPLREYLTESTASFMPTDSLVIGRIRNGACKDTVANRQGPWTGVRSSDNSRITVTLNMNINLDGKRYWNVGSQPCVRRVVTWEWPEEMNDFLIFDIDDGPRPTTARSDYRLTPNTIPRRQLVASPPMDGSVDVELVTPDGGDNDVDLPDLDVDSIDAPEIVLPDFLADDESQDPFDTLFGGVPEDTSFNTAEVRGAVQDLRTQFRTLARLLGVDTSGGQGQEGNPNLQQEAVREAARNPQNVARAIANARSALNTIANATSGSTDPAAAQAAAVVDTYNQQLDNFAGAAPVGVAGGVVTADAMSTVVGFDATQSPVAGTRGSGTLGGLTMKVKAPASAKPGKKATVRVTAQPRSAQGVIRIAVVRNTGQRLQVIAAQQVKLRNGKATTRVTVPKKAAKGSYTLMASLVPNTRSGSGITVQRPLQVR